MAVLGVSTSVGGRLGAAAECCSLCGWQCECMALLDIFASVLS